MPTTYNEAYVQITDHFAEKWEEQTQVILGFIPEVRYDRVEKGAIPTTTFARFVMEPVSNPRNALRNAEHGQRFENNGIIIVQLLVTRDDEQAALHSRLLGAMVQNIFRDPAFPGCYIFRNIRINNLEPEDRYLRTNVVLEYQFDEII